MRVLMAMSDQDGNDRGARAVALALREAGMEVVYAGQPRMVEEVAVAALQEDVDVVALVVPPRAGPSLTRRLLEKLEALGIRNDLKVVVGGAIPPRDVPRLRKMGLDGIFPAGTAPGEIAAWVSAYRRPNKART